MTPKRLPRLAALVCLLIPAFGLVLPQARAAQPVPLPDGRYRVLTDESRVTAHARSSLHDFEVAIHIARGRLTLPPAGAAEPLRLRLEFDPAAFSSGNFMRDAVMRRQVFETGKYPLATFESAEAAYLGKGEGGTHRFRVRGTLTLHGVTKPMEIPVRVAASGGRLVAEARFPLHFPDFGMSVPQPLPFLRVEENVNVEAHFVLKSERAGSHAFRQGDLSGRCDATGP